MSDLYRLIEQVANINNELTTLKNTVVNKNEFKNTLDELSINIQRKYDELYNTLIEECNRITKREIEVALEALHNSLKAEFKMCLETSIAKLQSL